jgi:surface polysaccharide O-acyltransferase-like enzyme
MSRESPNLAWLDLLRVAAAPAVVILHVAAEPVVFLQDRDSPLWHAGNILDSLCRWCIGVFVMVSGALLLDPSRRETVAEFFGKRVRRVLVPILFWSAVYIVLTAALGTPMAPSKVARLIWEGRPWYHMWYLFMILGLYAVTPVLRAYVSRASSRLRWVVAVLFLALAGAWDLQLSIEQQPLPSIVPTMFIPYLGYYLIGYEIRRVAPVRLHPVLLWGVFGVGAVATIIGTHALLEAYGTTRLGLYLYEYLSPNVILMSLAVFCLASRATGIEAGRGGLGGVVGRGVAWTAPLTLGVYLWHPMLILGLRKLGHSALGTESIFGVLLIALPAFAGSVALTFAMSKLPLLRQTVGLR